MGLFDEFGKALKKVEDAVKKADPGKPLKDAEDQLNKAGKEISGKAGESQPPAQPAASLPAAPSGALPAGKSRQPHPGYAKIAAWMKTKYKDRIGGTSDVPAGTPAGTALRGSLCRSLGKSQEGIPGIPQETELRTAPQMTP